MHDFVAFGFAAIGAAICIAVVTAGVIHLLRPLASKMKISGAPWGAGLWVGCAVRMMGSSKSPTGYGDGWLKFQIVTWDA